ncbi:MAG: hypothetical protein A3G33_10470 [Omnitrophica bacterium RIFCSPLOWO2_12_FULL_44_17]|uniref:4Fe-4S ferredoxin-type domain-containing protein n=1 Tax=Candidatus Danuiimicrobium aquiferis TaxID=1801832 RepID=A0A1G1KR82_9BACT|nr:MAG: hypothetical protein A3B72_02785 [Omnitrophica bacterium RIFCSPHIGHO2_02_FULL_45_28]OGW92123.1 MAG: hypothetical protein A3E74_02420 [Omnitrophica bacterium RIFCSPHIGHO2_12_FULL_44_12]OGW95398.1 MAG: hypothetical protein A3G33_10470 [Omnitrophica bacterium RIFCSPLOWO2_12_FULL_44_17]
MKKSLDVSLIFSTVLFAILLIFSLISSGQDWPFFYAKLLWSLIISCVGLCIYRTGLISKYRTILFIFIAFFFFLEFKCSGLLLLPQTIPPYCHIAQAPTLFNFIHSQFLAIASGDWKVWGTLTLGFLWLLIILTIGQGICSWVCFYGGIDEACSKLSRKPLIKLNITKAWRDFPIALLIFLLIISFLQGSPIFCSWFCPFKLTTTFWDTEPVARLIQSVLFWLVLILFVIVLPMLSKKRTFCSLICPFGALVSMAGKASPYRISIDKETCSRCGKCYQVCPVFAVEKQPEHAYQISSYCNRCGKCIDICPANAIHMSVQNQLTAISFAKRNGWQIEVQDIFIFLSLLITGVLSGSFVPRVILQLLGVK